jgi:hypothetical protein
MAMSAAPGELDRLIDKLNEEFLAASSAAAGGAADGGAADGGAADGGAADGGASAAERLIHASAAERLTVVHELLATKHSAKMAYPESAYHRSTAYSLFPNVTWIPGKPPNEDKYGSWRYIFTDDEGHIRLQGGFPTDEAAHDACAALKEKYGHRTVKVALQTSEVPGVCYDQSGDSWRVTVLATEARHFKVGTTRWTLGVREAFLVA